MTHPSIVIHYGGVIPSMKNSRQPITVGKGRSKRTIFRKNDDVVRVMRELSGLGMEALHLWDGQMLPDKTPFFVDIIITAPNYSCPDSDGVANTVLDSLQNVLYKNDAYCVYLNVLKQIHPSYVPSVEIRIGSMEAFENENEDFEDFRGIS